MTPSHASAVAASSGGRRTATFAGASVFLSRNLVAPEVFDAVHDALRLNGAEVFLCADPGRTGPLDFHVISSSSHERFSDLRAKGCNLLGPQCILSCAKERRSLPKQGYTCCLAMDGVKILCSGFEKDEKAKIEQFVKAMGGLLQTKVSMDVNFVIAKDVLAAKYKWAVNILKKPIVSMNWLEQCWAEHRVVPHESYRILPFSGLNICITKLNADERKELAKIIVQNGGQYSANLTRKCTHLVANMTQILTAIATDGNNQVFPVAFAFVESKNTDSWLWFLKNVRISVVQGRPNVCLIHDRHAGLLCAITQLQQGENVSLPWLDLQSRWCMRHLGANFYK